MSVYWADQISTEVKLGPGPVFHVMTCTNMKQVSVTFIGWTTSQVIHPLGLGDMTTNHSMYWQTIGISGSMSTCREHLLPDGGSVESKPATRF